MMDYPAVYAQQKRSVSAIANDAPSLFHLMSIAWKDWIGMWMQEAPCDDHKKTREVPVAMANLLLVGFQAMSRTADECCKIATRSRRAASQIQTTPAMLSLRVARY
jgi:hypothetical protein